MMMMQCRSLLAWARVGLVLASCALLSGCGGGNELGLVPVSGKILVDGQPLTNVPQGGVSFFADQAKGNNTMHIPTGIIDAEGNYELITGGEKGAPVGAYKVLVNAYENTVDEGPVEPRFMLEAKYYDLTRTDLLVEVVADPTPGQYDLHVTKKK
jgi:hypothetical protein